MCTVAAAVIGTLAGGVLQGYSANQQAKAQAAAQERQAAIYERNAQVLEDRAKQQDINNKMNEENKRRQISRAMGETRARTAASGLTMSGSPLDVLTDNRSNIETDMAIMGYNNRQGVDSIFQQSTDASNQAAQYRASAADTRRAGKLARNTALIKAGFDAIGIGVSAANLSSKSAAAQSGGKWSGMLQYSNGATGKAGLASVAGRSTMAARPYNLKTLNIGSQSYY